MIKYHNDKKCKSQSWEASIEVIDDCGFEHHTPNGYGATKLEAHRELVRHLKLWIVRTKSTIWELEQTMQNVEEPVEETVEERRKRLGWY